MTHPALTASRSQRRSLRRSQRVARSCDWRRVAMRPVALAVCITLGGAMGSSWAGGMNPLSSLSSHSIPIPVIPFTNAVGDKQNIASYGTGKGTVTVTNPGASNEVTNLQIDQETQKAIYNWQSFNIGQAAGVTFIMWQGKDSSALNRVSNSASASQIFGSLSSYYRDDKGKLVTGGEIYLINRNGIVFGKTAQVNVGSLIASALDMSDDDYKSGLSSINSAQPTFFKWVDTDPVTHAQFATYDPATNYVRVEGDETGKANITTASGGRVFLLGAKVDNSGNITSPNGQVVLAAGSEIYLNTPSSDKSPLYMSEANNNVPAVKGLLVEVNSDRKANEAATNTAFGSISTPTGNTTIVGWAVNQNGRISATTSVAQNGSVFLQARSGVQVLSTSGGAAYQKNATQGGQLVLGKSSSIEITPDQGTASQTVTANSTFTASRIELSGKTIDIQDKAAITAPGAVLNVRAEATPSYKTDSLVEAGSATDTQGRVTIGAGASIDVSGTKDTTVSVARNFVTTALLGATDLKDAPIQKDGPIYRSKLTFDIRQGSPILGDTSSYKNAVQMTANEFMSEGGTVSLTATGAVVTSNTASINVSGGQVNYSSALVNPSVLLAKNGQRYTLNSAPADQVYVGIAGVGDTAPTRFGTSVAPSLAGMAHVEEGYTQGSSGGKLNVVAPKVVLDAKLSGATVTGRRQAAGLDTLASVSQLFIGSSDNGTAGASALFGSSGFHSAVLGDMVVAKASQSLSDVYSSELPVGSRVSAGQLNDSGFGSVTVASNGNISVEDGADLHLPRQGSLTLLSAGSKGIVLGGDITSVGGNVSVQTLGRNPTEAAQTPSGTVVLAAGKHIDVSGNWVNQHLDGALVAPAVAGGAVTLSSGHGLTLGEGSSIDVSGGATFSSSGVIKGSDAGTISLISNKEALGTDAAHIAAFEMGASLRGFGFSKGGSLTMQAGSVELVNSTGTASNLRQGAVTGAVTVGADFLTQGGFQNYNIEGVSSLKVLDNTRLAPRVLNWSATPAMRNLATGSSLKSVAQVVSLPDGQRAATNLNLASSGVSGVSAQQAGTLSVGQGAQIVGDAGSKLALRAGLNMDVNGALQAAGGQISVTLNGRTTLADAAAPGSLHLGSQTSLDASGTTVYKPTTGAQVLGSVLDGGTVTVGVAAGTNTRSAVRIDEGATLKADGATGQLDVARPLGQVGQAYTRQIVASNGGSIQINVGRGGGTVSSQMSAKAGDSTALGGAFGLNMVDKTTGVIRVQDAIPAGDVLKTGEVTVSSSALQKGGFADVSLVAPQEINFKGQVDWAVPRSLTLTAPLVSLSDASSVKLSAGSALLMGRAGNLGSVVSQLGAGAQSNGLLTLESGLVGLFGQQALQGVKTLQINAGTEVRLLGANEGDAASKSGNLPGQLLTRADVNLHAPQVTVASASNYTLDASGATVTIDGGDASSMAPLSAGGQLTINAANINQNGVLRVPFGKVVLNATQSIHLGGLTSVSGQDLLVPFGSTTGGGTSLSYISGGIVAAPVEKAVVLNGQNVDVSSSATVNLNGGGAMVAYEFVPGPGGSKDVFAGALNGAFAVVPSITKYAPTDAAILADGAISQASGPGNALALGNTVTFGNNGILPAGTYAVLPARYALLPGAYLVKPMLGSGAVSLNYRQGQTDGSAIVGGLLGSTGVSVSNKPSSAFMVMSSQTARRYSEIKTTSLDAYFADKAAFAGVAAPRLAADAGRLAVVAAQAQLDGVIGFAHAGGLGGQLDLSSSNIHVGSGNVANALNISYEQVNKTGADSVVLGGVRQATGSDGATLINVTAANVTVDADQDAQGQPRSLNVGDLTLAATGSVKLNDGVKVSAQNSTASTSALTVKGNGALVRVSADAGAVTTRDLSGVSQVGAGGDLFLGRNVSLTGGAVVAEATRSTSMASGAVDGVSISARKVVVGAQRMVAGDLPSGASLGTGSTLVLSDQLLSQFNQAQDLTLRSFGGVDLYQGASLGSAATRSLTIDTANVRIKGSSTNAQIQAGSVQMRNTTGVAVEAGALDTGTLTVSATGNAGGSGHITVGGGNIGIAGAGTTQLNAAGSVVLAGNGGLSTPGDLQLSATSLTAQQGTVSNLQSGSWFRLSAPAAGSSVMASATPGLGAQVNITAATIDQQGKVVLPSGSLSMTAKYQLRFGATSTTDLSGSAKSIDGVALDSMGGTLAATSRLADVTQIAGAVIDVSAGGGHGTAGSMNFNAVQGSVKLQGSLLARSSNQQSGGSLSVDSGKAVDLQALGATIDTGRGSATSNFGQSISVRTRLKGQDLNLKSGTTLRAENIDLSSDQGDIDLSGALHATSQTGGAITVSAGGDVRVNDGADLQAHADAASKAVQTTGGAIELSSAGMVRSGGALGSVKLLGGNIDTSGLNGGQNGRLKVRASADALLADTSAVGTRVTGAQAVTVEAMKVIQASAVGNTSASVVDQTTLDQASAYVADLFDASSGNSKAQRIATRMASLQAGSAQVRAGVEIQSPGDLTLGSDLNLIGWRSGAGSVLDAAPVNLTLRAGGNLNVQGSISDGFLGMWGDTSSVSSLDVIQPGLAGDIRLVGGADLKAARVMATKVAGSAGDVIIGRTDNGQTVDVMVRSTTGDVKIATARDVTLLNPRAVVYTTGQSVPMSEGYYLDDLGDFPALLSGATSPFMTRGGSISVLAGRDVIGMTDTSKSSNPKYAVQQYVTDWWWRRKDDDGTLTWWSRYDLFQQGFGTFGGGNVSVQAGRDAWNVSVSASAGGYQNVSGTSSFGGGSVSLKAGRDVVGGSTFAADNTTVLAGRNITSQTSTDSALYASRQATPSALSIFYGNGQTSVMARNNAAVGNLTQAGLFNGPFRGTVASANFAMLGLTPDASVGLSSVAGDLALTNDSVNRYLYTGLDSDADGNTVLAKASDSLSNTPVTVLAANTSLQAGQGNINSTGDTYQVAAIRADQQGGTVLQPLNLSLLARDNLIVKSITQYGSDARAGTPSVVQSYTGGVVKFDTNLLKSGFATSTTLVGDNGHSPVRLVAEQGDVSYGVLDLKQAVHVIAGRDISADSGVRVQHQSANDLSLFEAGRDFNLSTQANQFGIDVNGPGDVVFVTGRALNLYQTQGIRALGNRSNPELPGSSANVAVLTGVSFAKGDVTSAANAYFEVLGGAGVGDFAPDLYAQLSAVDQGQTLPGLGSAAAKAFAALSVGEQVSRAKSMVGDVVYQQRVLSFMQHRDDPSLTLPDALSKFNALSDADKAPMVGLLLTSAWTSKVPQASQLDTVMSMAASSGRPYTDQLVSFMQLRTGNILTPKDAIGQFASLTPQEQVLFSAKVLVSEMNAAVSKAANLSGQAKNEAYIKAYNALDTMFPSASVKHADLQMGASTIQTQQGSAIQVLAPNGAVNVGQLTASAGSKDASQLGLITAGGGDLAVAARDDVLVNQSRIFTVGKGDELIWSSVGNVDAGRGGKTVTAAAAPVFYLDKSGKLQVDVTAAIAGSGIASSGVARIAAPKGEINAGDAGISAGGGLELAASVVRGADNIQAPSIAGAPAAAPVNTAMAAPTPNQPTAAGAKEASDDGEGKSKKRKKRNILLDFLGFGSGSES